MKLSCAAVRVTLENTKGKEFEVTGYYWGDGTLRVDNPRPDRYPVYQFLYTEPDIFDDDDPKRLYWLADDEGAVGELSPFRVKYALAVIKPVKKRGKIAP